MQVRPCKGGLLRSDKQERVEPIELWLKLQRYIHKIALKYSGGSEELHEDLMQESYFALLSALEHYDGSSNFTAYYRYWLKQRFLRYIDPHNTQRRVRQYKRIVSDFERDFGRLPTDNEIRAATGCNPDAIRREVLAVDALSMDYPIDEEEATFADVVPDETADTESQALETVSQEELKTTLWALVDELPAEQADTIRKRYKENKSVKQCSEELNVSQTHVRGVEAKAMRKLRSSKIRKQLEPYIDDIRYSYGVSSEFDPTANAAFRTLDYMEKLRNEGLL